MQFKHLAKPLSRLFRTIPHDAPAPADPIAAIDSAAPELLMVTALGDGDETLRAAAIRQGETRKVERRAGMLAE